MINRPIMYKATVIDIHCAQGLSKAPGFLNKKNASCFTIEGLRAKRAYIAFLADFHFLQDRANFWQTDLF